jgi:hypothetical protein
LKSPPQRAACADPPARQAMKAMAKAYFDIRMNPTGNGRESGARSCPGTGFASKRQILARTDRCLPATNQMRSPPP